MDEEYHENIHWAQIKSPCSPEQDRQVADFLVSIRNSPSTAPVACEVATRGYTIELLGNQTVHVITERVAAKDLASMARWVRIGGFTAGLKRFEFALDKNFRPRDIEIAWAGVRQIDDLRFPVPIQGATSRSSRGRHSQPVTREHRRSPEPVPADAVGR